MDTESPHLRLPPFERGARGDNEDLGDQDDQQRKLEVLEETGSPYSQFPTLERGADELERCLERGRALGLIEVFERPNVLPTYRVPRLLAGLVVLPGDGEVLAKVGAEVLHRLWWESDYQYSEEQALEIHRLALVGKAGEIAVKIAAQITDNWNNKSRFWDAVKICLETLEIVNDHQIFHQLAKAQQQLGEVQEATFYYQQALATCPVEDEQEKSVIIHNLATLYANQGEIDQAITLYQQSLELKEKIGDVQGKAATLHQLAILYANQGEIDQAIALFQQSLEITEKIGDVQIKAATLHCLASIYANQGEIDQAIALFQQSLELDEKIGNVRGKAATLHEIARIYANQGEIDQAIALYQQSIEITEKIRDVKTKASTLHQLAILYENQGEIDQAIVLYQQSIEIKEKIGNVQGKAATLAMMGQLLVDEKGDYQQGLAYLEQSLAILQRLRSPDAATVQRIIAQIRG
jgi:tetratricopeptide (TPR) repeat protein